MNSAEEILQSVEGPRYVRERGVAKKSMQEHTRQRLEELKERVEKMYADTRRYPDKTFKLVDKNEVITLIEEVQAKHIQEE